jgi:hypothetical protein
MFLQRFLWSWFDVFARWHQKVLETEVGFWGLAVLSNVCIILAITELPGSINVPMAIFGMLGPTFLVMWRCWFFDEQSKEPYQRCICESCRRAKGTH